MFSLIHVYYLKIKIINEMFFHGFNYQIITKSLTRVFSPKLLASTNIIQLLVFEEPNIEIYRCVKGDIDRGQCHLSNTDKSRHWALQTPIIIVLLLFCVKRLVDIVKTAMFSSVRLQIIMILLFFIYLFVNLIYGKALLQIYIDFFFKNNSTSSS